MDMEMEISNMGLKRGKCTIFETGETGEKKKKMKRRKKNGSFEGRFPALAILRNISRTSAAPDSGFSGLFFIFRGLWTHVFLSFLRQGWCSLLLL